MPIAVLLPLLVSILTQAPQVIESVQAIWKLAKRNDAPTAEEEAAFAAASAAAHKAVQEM